jgi:hypothetical protein
MGSEDQCTQNWDVYWYLPNSTHTTTFSFNWGWQRSDTDITELVQMGWLFLTVTLK